MIFLIKIIYSKLLINLVMNITNQIIVSFKLLMIKKKNQLGKQKLMIIYFKIKLNNQCKNY